MAYYAGQIGKVSIEWNGEIYLRKTGQTQYSEETGIEGGDSRTIESYFTADSWMHALNVDPSQLNKVVNAAYAKKDSGQVADWHCSFGDITE